MNREEYFSRDYDFKDIEIDPRFKVCRREMIITLAIWFLYAIISIVVAYELGKGPVEAYSYVMGLPQWWFATIVITLIFTLVVIGVTLFVFKDMDLTDVGTVMKDE